MSLILSLTIFGGVKLAHAFEPVLAPLAEHFCRPADTLLDLRACVLYSTRPGRCVACYFSLQTAAAERAIAKLCPLRTWLETHIEVVASLAHLFGGKGGYWEDQGYEWYAGI